MNIGQFITYLILNTELKNEEILKEVHKKFVGANTKMASIAWYKSKLRKEGKLSADKNGKFKLDMTEEELAAEYVK